MNFIKILLLMTCIVIACLVKNLIKEAANYDYTEAKEQFEQHQIEIQVAERLEKKRHTEELIKELVNQNLKLGDYILIQNTFNGGEHIHYYKQNHEGI